MNKIISVASGFQYSVNIGYDLNQDDKLQNFIPTRTRALSFEVLFVLSKISFKRLRDDFVGIKFWSLSS